MRINLNSQHKPHSTRLKFPCNLGARRCNVGLVLERCRDGDEIILQAPEPQSHVAELMAKALRSHLQADKRNVTVTVQLVNPAATVPERQAIAQRIAQRV